ncbi:agamous-like MADS-box protein AGL104 isoform X4 [Raphanus sativus]|uniref:Agamous-like MADS-box protein AGL104 isoform X4 n=1 Tax=Raphanus sativus TaxID=3726 RepID=A0A9W3CG73_RAPSA|nr:agamous-like MADS-box protein AGL104 isoform X4 [Raphanus sativus]
MLGPTEHFCFNKIDSFSLKINTILTVYDKHKTYVIYVTVLCLCSTGVPPLTLKLVRIEDVLEKYINLPDQERDKGIKNKEYLLRTLEQIKTENDMAFQINEPRHEAIHSDVEELEKEVCRLKQQLHISAEELRKFEPDPVRFTSMEEMEACETHLLSTLTRVVQRREHLLSRSCGAPSTQQSMENIEGWEPEAESKQARIIANSAYASNQLSYDLLLQGSNSNPTQTPK